MTEPEETIASVAADHPVTVALLFGSHGRREATAASDVDVAVAFDEDAPSDARFSLGADLAVALGTDDVDVVDLETAPASLVRAVFRDGRRLVGSERTARQLRDRLLAEPTETDRSLGDRFDDAIETIDDHLA